MRKLGGKGVPILDETLPQAAAQPLQLRELRGLLSCALVGDWLSGT